MVSNGSRRCRQCFRAVHVLVACGSHRGRNGLTYEYSLCMTHLIATESFLIGVQDLISVE